MTLPELLRRVDASPTAARTLRVIDAVSTALTASALAVGVYLTYLTEPRETLSLLLTLFVPFVLVSLLRLKIGAPRPCELFGLRRAHRGGGGFPSRHAHSAFAIGTALLFVSVPLGVAVLVLGLCLGACRVLLGYHFPRDVIVGALTGASTAAIGMLIL